MIVLLELLIALLEYINLILQLSFFQQEFILSYKYLTYYAGIMLNAFRYLLCSKLRQHNRQVPTDNPAESSARVKSPCRENPVKSSSTYKQITL